MAFIDSCPYLYKHNLRHNLDPEDMLVFNKHFCEEIIEYLA